MSTAYTFSSIFKLVTILSFYSVISSVSSVTIDTQHLDKRLNVPADYVAAPYYPTPRGGWVADWSESYRKAALLVANMTLAEKTNITCGSGYDMGEPYMNQWEEPS